MRERTRVECVIMKSSVAKHYGFKRARHCGLITNGRRGCLKLITLCPYAEGRFESEILSTITLNVVGVNRASWFLPRYDSYAGELWGSVLRKRVGGEEVHSAEESEQLHQAGWQGRVSGRGHYQWDIGVRITIIVIIIGTIIIFVVITIIFIIIIVIIIFIIVVVVIIIIVIVIFIIIVVIVIIITIINPSINSPSSSCMNFLFFTESIDHHQHQHQGQQKQLRYQCHQHQRQPHNNLLS